MTHIECQHLDEKQICQGMYSGFGCIEDRCRDPTKGLKACVHLRGDGYCKKHGRFHCTGKECEDFEA